MVHKLAREEFKNLDKNRDWKPCFWQKNESFSQFLFGLALGSELLKRKFWIRKLGFEISDPKRPLLYEFSMSQVDSIR